MLRTDKSLILLAAENPYGALPSSGWARLGYHDSANLPDPEYGWFPYYSLKSSKRVSIIKGRQSYSGSIPDITLNLNTLFPFLTLIDDIPLPSFSISAQTFDTTGASTFNRIYSGGRIGRATLSAAEGEPLKVSIDEMMFNSVVASRSNIPPERINNTHPTDSTGQLDLDRWVYSGANIVFNGVVLNRVKRFSIDIDNSLTPWYGIRTGNINLTQSPIRILTGQNKYTLNLDVDFVDEGDFSLFDYLFNQGSPSAGAPMTGVIIVATFVRMESTLTIRISPAPTTRNPGTVFTKAEMPFDVVKSGYYGASFSANVDKITFA